MARKRNRSNSRKTKRRNNKRASRKRRASTPRKRALTPEQEAALARKRTRSSWPSLTEFLSWLKSRGLHGVRMISGDKDAGMVGSIERVFPEAKYQRCTVHFYRNVLSKVPKNRRKHVAGMLKAIHAQESFAACREKAENVAEALEKMKLSAAAKTVRDGAVETLTYASFLKEH